MTTQAALDRLLGGLRDGVRWGVSVRDAHGVEVAAHDASDVLATASVGKLLLLLEVARQYDTGTLAPDEPLARTPDLAVADSGLWQHLRAEELCVEDLAVLTAAVSDNLATNVLLERVGLAPLRALAAGLGLAHTSLLDRVRDHRGPADPPRLAEGTAAELSELMARLEAGDLVSPTVSGRVERWLAAGTDLSMVASAFGLDPLAHADAEGGVVLRHKTGTDTGVRADVGLVRGPSGVATYAVIANGVTDPVETLAVMREIGDLVRVLVR